jgi:glutaconate CoA-transferase, subunit A
MASEATSDEAQAGRWRRSVDELAAVVEPRQRISVGGVHFMRAPVALLRAVAARATPLELTYVAWGGGLPLEFLLANGLVTSAEICFSGMDIYGAARRFRRYAENGALRVLDYTALGLTNGLRAQGENLAWEVLQEPAGSHVMDEICEHVESAGVPMVKVPPVRVDVMLLHAQRADDAGNVEITGARATDLATAFAARQVLVTVEERVRVGELGAPRSFILPRSHVSGIALAPFGAFPTSCLPYYTAHYETLERTLDADAGEFDRLVASPGPDVAAQISGYAKWEPANPALLFRTQVSDSDPEAPPTIDEVMTVLIACSVTNNSVCSFGSASLLPAAAYLFAKASHAPNALLMSTNGGYVDIASRPLSLSFAEVMDYRSAVVHAGGDETYHWYYQPGRITHEVVGAAQVDATGSTNNLWITKADDSRIRLPGQGGMADVANLHRDFVIYIPRQDPRNTVPAVEVISARRDWADAALRRSFGLTPGKIEFVTDYGIMSPNPATGRLEIAALHPGRNVEQFRAACGFAIDARDELRTTVAPTVEQLHLLRQQIDPLGVRKLDFVPSRDRTALIHSILASERAAWLADSYPTTKRQQQENYDQRRKARRCAHP